MVHSETPSGAGTGESIRTSEGSAATSVQKAESESRSVVSDSLQSYGLYSPRNSSGQNTGVGSLSLLQGIFPIQVSCTAGGFFTSSAIRDGLAVLEGSYVNIYFTFSK